MNQYLALFVSDYSGTTDDALRQLLLANGATSGTINDLWMQFFVAQGITSGTIDDRMRQFLLTYTEASDTGQTIDDLWSLITGPYTALTGFLLDDYGTGAEAAYSTRKLASANSLSMNVRRTSDSANEDIGFSDVDLDTAAITTFIGGSSGTVRFWYDQSTGQEDTSLGTAASQPFIRTSGVQETAANGKPAARSTATSTHAIPNGGTNLVKSIFCVFQTTDTAAVDTWWLGKNAGGTIGIFAGGASNTGPGYINGASTVEGASEDTSTHVLSVVLSGTTATVHLDNTSLGTVGSLSDLGPIESVLLGFVGQFCEVVIYSTDKTSDRLAITQNMADYWGVTLA